MLGCDIEINNMLVCTRQPTTSTSVVFVAYNEWISRCG